MKTLADALGVDAPGPVGVPAVPLLNTPLDVTVMLTGRAFSQAVLRSEEFRIYVAEGLTRKNLPPAVMLRLMDHGWGKPPERVEHTGKDGAPIITEVRRVIVRAQLDDLEDSPPAFVDQPSKVTH